MNHAVVRIACPLVAAMILATSPRLEAAPQSPPTVAADPAIAFIRSENVRGSGYANIWVMNADGQRPTRIVQQQAYPESMKNVALDSRGDMVAAQWVDGVHVQTWRIVKNPSNASFVPSATDMRELTFSAAECDETAPTEPICGKTMWPEWSPDGMSIAATVVARIGDRRSIRVWTYDDASRTTGSWRTLFMTAGSEYTLHPTWSPDGTEVGFRYDDRVNPRTTCVVPFPAADADGWDTCAPVPSQACSVPPTSNVEWKRTDNGRSFVVGVVSGGVSGKRVDDEFDGCSGVLNNSGAFSEVYWTPDDRALVGRIQGVDARGRITYKIVQLCLDPVDPVTGPNRRLLLLGTSDYLDFGISRRRDDGDGATNVCDIPGFPQG